MSGKRPSRRGELGMTLVELLVSLTLLGMVSVLMMGGLSFGARSWERIGETSETVNDTLRVHAFLREHMSGLAQPDSVSGESEEMSFTGLWLTALDGVGLYEFRLSRRDDRVILSWTPTMVGSDDGVPGERAVLEGAEALTIQYFGQPPGHPAPEWLDRWQPEWEAPRLVRVTIDFAEPGRSWPMLTVALPDLS